MIQKKSTMMRAVSVAIAVIFMFVSLMASTQSVGAASKLKVTVTKKTIYVGQTIKFKSNKNVKWSVSKKKVAKLTAKKKRAAAVKGLKAGTTYVVAKAGKQTKKIKITIKAKPKLKLSLSENVIGLGEYSNVFVEQDNKSLSSSKVTFTSSDKSVAYVSNTGLIQGLDVGTATITAKLKSDSKIKASIRIEVIPARAAKLKFTVSMTDENEFPAGKVTKAWLPVPQNDENQMIYNIDYDIPETATAKYTRDSDGGKQLYVEWDENTLPEDRTVTLTYQLYRRAIVLPENIESLEKGEVDKEKFEYALRELYWSGPIDSGIVKETADKIVADYGAKTVYEKAHAIYDWMCDNLTRYDDITKPLKGDVPAILEEMRANTCIEVSQVFAMLCRAEGIPARSLYGVRFINPNGIPSANCRAEFYLPGYGWVAADPALAIKQSWGHEDDYLSPDAPERAKWESIKDNYWGNAEENWICLNKGHDITLNPPQEADSGGEYLEVLNPDNTINYYILPYVEYDGQYKSVGKFKYGYEYTYVDPADCGCL